MLEPVPPCSRAAMAGQQSPEEGGSQLGCVCVCPVPELPAAFGGQLKFRWLPCWLGCHTVSIQCSLTEIASPRPRRQLQGAGPFCHLSLRSRNIIFPPWFGA